MRSKKRGIQDWISSRSLRTRSRRFAGSSITESFFTQKRAKALLNTRCKISDLLNILIGDEALYQHYLFDQQFSHQGWSGIVSVIEDQPELLLDSKRISLKDFIIFELLLEIDALDAKFGEIWAPLGAKIRNTPTPLFEEVPETEFNKVLSLWQDAYEWSYYDEVLAGLTLKKEKIKQPAAKKQKRQKFKISE